MPSGHSFFIDTTICTGCRACQTACKEWNDNASQKTTMSAGTYQNPPDLNYDTFKLVRYAEELQAGEDPKQYFFTDQCRHCVFPLCKVPADQHAPGAIEIDPETRAVIFNPEVKVSPKAFEEIRKMCPFDIPRYNSELSSINKCTMCNERVHAGMKPACVKACPTGSMNFGLREDMLKQANDSLSKLRRTDKRAQLIDPGAVRVVYLVKDHPDKYHRHAKANSLRGVTRRAGLKGTFRVLASFLGISRTPSA